MGALLNSTEFYIFGQLFLVAVVFIFFVVPIIKNLNLNRTSERQVGIPIESIFLHYQHKNLEEWYKWIQKQSAEIKNQAFGCLIRYLEQSANSFKPVLKDVLRMISVFKKPGGETAIFHFLQKISLRNPPKEYYTYYAHALKALIEINPQRASSFLDNEYQKHQDNPEYVKRFVFASSFFDADRLPEKLLTNYLLNTNYILDERLKLLKNLKKEDEKFYIISKNILFKLLDNKDYDQAITEDCFINFLKLKDIKQEDFLKTIKTLFDKTWVSDHLVAILKNHLIQSKDYQLNPISMANIISCINPISYDSLKAVLCNKFSIDENEEKLIKEAENYSRFKKQSIINLEQAITILDSEQNELPSILEEKLQSFRDFCFNNKYDCLKILNGSNLDEMFLLTKKVALDEKKKLLIIDIEQLAQDQTMLDNLETHLKAIQNKIVFIPEFELLIHKIQGDDNEKEVYRKIFNRIKFFTLKSGVAILGTCDKKKLSKTSLEFLDKEVPKEEYDACDFNEKTRANILNEYLSFIDPERKNDLSVSKELNLLHKAKSKFSFLHFFLEYAKLSLLSQGKLFTEKSYRVIMENQDNDEVSIKDLVAKVKIRD